MHACLHACLLACEWNTSISIYICTEHIQLAAQHWQQTMPKKKMCNSGDNIHTGWSAVLRQVYDTYSVIHECKRASVRRHMFSLLFPLISFGFFQPFVLLLHSCNVLFSLSHPGSCVCVCFVQVNYSSAAHLSFESKKMMTSAPIGMQRLDPMMMMMMIRQKDEKNARKKCTITQIIADTFF